MTTRFVVHTAVAAAIAFAVTASLQAQSVTLPPDGNNPKASASLSIGLVEVSITYNSPKVTAPRRQRPQGQDLGPARALRDGQPGVRDLRRPVPVARRRQREHGVFRVARRQGRGAAAARRLVRPLHDPRRGRVDRHLLQEPHVVGELLLQGRGGPAPRQGQAGGGRVPPLADLRVHRPRPRHGDGGAQVGAALGAVDDHGRQRDRPLRREPAPTSCAPRRGSPGRRGSRRRGSASTGRSTSTKGWPGHGTPSACRSSARRTSRRCARSPTCRPPTASPPRPGRPSNGRSSTRPRECSTCISTAASSSPAARRRRA